jgi:hypothetical protein
MNKQFFHYLPPAGLLIGSALGLAGSFVDSESLRGLLWGIDGIALVLAASLLTIYHFRKDNDVVAAGFLIFVAGETLVLGSNGMTLEAAAPIFGAGISLWATSLILISLTAVMPKWTRFTGLVAGVLFLMAAVHIFSGDPIHSLSKPLPFYIYPLFVITLLGWAWQQFRETGAN